MDYLSQSDKKKCCRLEVEDNKLGMVKILIRPRDMSIDSLIVR